MSLSQISNTTIDEEQIIQKQIFRLIDNYEDIIFNAGAGSGKTYALIESLKYIVRNHGNRLKHHNQRIVCITYTNAAADEIKKRLGNSELVNVSTIHEKLWSVIKNHQKELLDVHSKKVKNELEQLKNDLNENSEAKIEKQFSVYRSLTPELKDQLKEYISEKKEVYYKKYNKPAAEFKAIFIDDLKLYSNILKNVANFKKIVNTIFKIQNYTNCLEQIAAKNKKYMKVKYDSTFNNDILHRMFISHDTLLDYALKMFEQYDLLKQIVIDSSPYILIDEYQDTNKCVVEIMQLLATHSRKIRHSLFIGYFGDTVQNIYDDGVGNKIEEIYPDLNQVEKIFNRRSYSEIIDVINKIRNDKIEQKSIFDDCTGGSVKFYSYKNGNKYESVEKFIKKYQEQWQITTEKKLHCFVLTNKLVAELSGFPDVYQYFSETDFYKKYYDQTNTELLSNELEKLGEVPIAFYKIIQFQISLKNPKTALTKIFHQDLYSKLTFFELKGLIKQLNSINGTTLGEYTKALFEEYDLSEKGSYYRQVINKLINIDQYSIIGFFNFLLDRLFPDLDSDDNQKVGDANDKLNELLNVNLSQYTLWYDFINKKQDAEVIYHTYHGTKGLEFDNVIIIMQNDFGRMNKNKFSSFFKNFLNPEDLTDEKEKFKFKNTQNLLYVSCSRAIKNLRILYLDDTLDFENGIKNIFGELYIFPN